MTLSVDPDTPTTQGPERLRRKAPWACAWRRQRSACSCALIAGGGWASRRQAELLAGLRQEARHSGEDLPAGVEPEARHSGERSEPAVLHCKRLRNLLQWERLL